MVRTISRRTAPKPAPLSKESLVRRLKRWSLIKSDTEALTKEQNALRDEMMAYAERIAADAEESGEVPEGLIEFDEKGSIFIPLPAFDGPRGKIAGFKRERRASPIFDEDAALALLAAKEDSDTLRSRVVKTIEVIDQDEFYLLQQEGLISEEELDSLFEEKITWAFKPVAG